MAKTVNLNRVLDQVLPWDLVITIDDEDYQTRPLTLGDLALLSEAAGGKVTQVDGLITMVKSLFHIEPPGLKDWTLEQMMGVIAIVQDYWADRTKKNQPLVAAAVRNVGQPTQPTQPAAAAATAPTMSGS